MAAKVNFMNLHFMVFEELIFTHQNMTLDIIRKFKFLHFPDTLRFLLQCMAARNCPQLIKFVSVLYLRERLLYQNNTSLIKIF